MMSKTTEQVTHNNVHLGSKSLDKLSTNVYLMSGTTEQVKRININWASIATEQVKHKNAHLVHITTVQEKRIDVYMLSRTNEQVSLKSTTTSGANTANPCGSSEEPTPYFCGEFVLLNLYVSV